MRFYTLVLILILSFPGLAIGKHKLIFATEGGMPPFSWTDKQGKPQGFDPDIATALCKEMDAKCIVVISQWDYLPVGLISGKFDILISDMDKLSEREGLMLFTDSYVSKTASFVAKTGRFSDYSPEGLAGKTVAVMDNTSYESYLESRYSHKVDCVYTETTRMAFSLLSKGKVDLVLTDTPIAKIFLNMPEGKGFSYVSQSHVDSELDNNSYIAVRKDDIELRNKLNEAIRAIKVNGIYQKIYNKYFNK